MGEVCLQVSLAGSEMPLPKHRRRGCQKVRPVRGALLPISFYTKALSGLGCVYFMCLSM